MKKLFVFGMIFALSFALSGVSMAAINTNTDGFNINTGLTKDTTGGQNPLVKAKWEANGAGQDISSPLDYYMDDSPDSGAQFLPSGQYQVNKTIALCAIATDPDGLADINNVYADVFYPVNVELGPSHVALEDQSADGCGELMQEDTLIRLSKADGIALFCNNVKNENNNLPTFEGGYDYDEICAADGELQKETAAVYCATKELSYEDPAGDYEVWAVAQDKVGLQDKLINHFTYLPLTAFETDFSGISYGTVRLNTHKIINGDLTWDEPIDTGPASVRNIGNTRLAMQVLQDDMGLGKSSGLWNVRYDARVGNDENDWIDYYPEETTLLADELDLSELDEMDFSILISKFPPANPGPSYSGDMTLSAVSREHLVCDGPQPETRHISLENKNSVWQVLSDDEIYGDIEYSHNYDSFFGVVTGTGLVPNAKYQITLNGPGVCTETDGNLAGNGASADLFAQGYWNGVGPGLSNTCSDPGEGVYNMGVVGNDTGYWTIMTDSNGAFNYPFDIALPPGDYVDVKVLVKKMLDTFTSPWVDTGAGYPEFNLYETAAINFTVLSP